MIKKINVKELRKRNNLTQGEFADRLEVKRTTYATWEQESIYPTYILEKISQEFAVSFDDLVESNYNIAVDKVGNPKDGDTLHLIIEANERLIAAKDQFIEHLQDQLAECKMSNKTLNEILNAVNSWQQNPSNDSTRGIEVGDMELEKLAKLIKSNYNKLALSDNKEGTGAIEGGFRE